MPLTLNQAIRKIVGPYNSTAQASRDLFKTIKDIEALPKDLQPLVLKFIASMYDLSYTSGGELALYPKSTAGVTKAGGWVPDGEPISSAAGSVDSTIYTAGTTFMIISASSSSAGASTLTLLNVGGTKVYYIGTVADINIAYPEVPMGIIMTSGLICRTSAGGTTGRVCTQKMKWQNGP